MAKLSEITKRAAPVRRPKQVRSCSLCNGQGTVRSGVLSIPDPPDLPRPDAPRREPCWGCQLEAAEAHYGIGTTGRSKAGLSRSPEMLPIRPTDRAGRLVDDDVFCALVELGWVDEAPADDPRHLAGSGWFS